MGSKERKCKIGYVRSPRKSRTCAEKTRRKSSKVPVAKAIQIARPIQTTKAIQVARPIQTTKAIQVARPYHGKTKAIAMAYTPAQLDAAMKVQKAMRSKSKTRQSIHELD